MEKEKKILYINLNERTFESIKRPDLNKYIGGVSLGTQLLEEECLFDESSLSPEQPIIFTKGPMNTIFPVVTKTCCMFKSPLTEELGESYGGMRMAMAMGLAGLDGIILKGSSPRPCILHINNDEVKFLDGEPLWGLNTDEATRLLHDKRGRRGLRSIITIGKGGEKQIKYACGLVDTYRHFGRLGLGCLLGIKMVKAIVIEGSRSNPISNTEDYRKAYEKIYKKVTDTDLMEKYHGLGTSINIKSLNDLGALPAYNFSKSKIIDDNSISGEFLAENKLIKKVACSGCPIGCIHIALLKRKFGDPYEYEASTVSYDHELIYALGSMLGILDADKLLRLIEAVELTGLDAITTGVMFAWMTEAYEKKIIDDDLLLTKPGFGDIEAYLQIISNIISQPNKFYIDAADGTYALASKYGGLNFAMVLGKNEVAGYHTGYGNIIGQAVGARHSHLDNAGYAIDQELQEFNPTEIVNKLINEEIDRNLLNSLVICLFSRKIYDYETIEDALNSIGYNITKKQLKELGLNTFLDKIRIKEKMGFSYQRLQIPKRFFETECCGKRLEEKQADEILRLYIDEVEKLKQKYSFS
ncbi:aldehyde ferredoxin oxidoreductase N-terminal domain-containing protein [Alkaliphilus peptidifermentans]|uniref:Aldehyde:ferredoxin oxidoreductase n=1 Tax=Alkaliphilus peptidifermentans DSM 18978 TaxID=1120976 RepID=A0A1G5CQ96_9FIRM|nr:aldehyde ferredoxin oxidoreductase N-terminal domain-containing protein [Alkaliphilus peptidifermentans]SCY04497.1 aldehyde:ferredoxin oxidoreductase [Alkaliphilus peptidifermentans DSM 18978]